MTRAMKLPVMMRVLWRVKINRFDWRVCKPSRRAARAIDLVESTPYSDGLAQGRESSADKGLRCDDP
jgi:hypothetical protein